MKRIILIILFNLLVVLVISQNSGNFNFSLGKYTSSYRFFKNYTGYVSANIAYSHPFAEKLYLTTKYSFGFMQNERTNNNAFNNSLNLGITYDILEKEKLLIKVFCGTGYQHIYMKTLYDIDFNEYLNGIPITSSLKFVYKKNENIRLFLDFGSSYGFMFKSDFAPYPYYFRTWFNSINLGVLYYH